MKIFWPGTEVQSSKSVKDNFKLGQEQRYRGTQLEFSCYFTYLLEFLLKIDQSTEVHRYRTPNLPKMRLFWPGTGGTKVHSSKSAKENFKLSQIQRYRGTQLKFPCYFTDLLTLLLNIAKGTGVHRYRTQNLPKMKIFWPGTEVQRYTAQNL